MVLAVTTGSAPEDVGMSVDPNTETISLIPAAAYCDLIVALSASVYVVHSYAFKLSRSIKGAGDGENPHFIPGTRKKEERKSTRSRSHK